jgi:hypothetical protein
MAQVNDAEPVAMLAAATSLTRMLAAPRTGGTLPFTMLTPS